MKDDVEPIVIDEDTLIHIGGMPFFIVAGATIYGRKENWDLVNESGPALVNE